MMDFVKQADSRRDKATLTHDERQALLLFAAMTGGSFDVYSLAGAYGAQSRAKLLTVLEGKRVPQSRAGIHAIEEAFFKLAYVTGNCHHAARESFQSWAKDAIGQSTVQAV